MVAYENDAHRAPSKLHPILRGPCRIVNRVVRTQGDVYTVQHLDSSKMEDFHVKLLRRYRYNPQYHDPVVAATADRQTFVVETILGHRFVPNRQIRSNMQVLVKWAGYEDSENSWEPYANSATVKIFHDYLREHGLQRLLRDAYKTPAQAQRR